MGCASTEVKTEGYDFRQTNWGMSEEEVRNVDNITNEGIDRAGNRYFIAADEFAELPCRVTYYFSDGKLMGGGYIFTIVHAEKSEYIDDYEKVQRYLNDIHGTPADEKIYWQDIYAQAEYEDEPEHWGDAISRGQLSFVTKWETKRTLIESFLRGANQRTNLTIRYMKK